jgi:hypothetical protein
MTLYSSSIVHVGSVRNVLLLFQFQCSVVRVLSHLSASGPQPHLVHCFLCFCDLYESRKWVASTWTIQVQFPVEAGSFIRYSWHTDIWSDSASTGVWALPGGVGAQKHMLLFFSRTSFSGCNSSFVFCVHCPVFTPKK